QEPAQALACRSVKHDALSLRERRRETVDDDIRSQRVLDDLPGCGDAVARRRGEDDLIAPLRDSGKGINRQRRAVKHHHQRGPPTASGPALARPGADRTGIGTSPRLACGSITVQGCWQNVLIKRGTLRPHAISAPESNRARPSRAKVQEWLAGLLGDPLRGKGTPPRLEADEPDTHRGRWGEEAGATGQAVRVRGEEKGAFALPRRASSPARAVRPIAVPKNLGSPAGCPTVMNLTSVSDHEIAR